MSKDKKTKTERPAKAPAPRRQSGGSMSHRGPLGLSTLTAAAALVRRATPVGFATALD